ncbi:M14 family metallopeptidase [Metabacillus sp. RGM 3146]|uniref:M14 family metallopeptidase n=1 Tax=Metabacillus sp. RGM 3146 TaxID=3401092 RepID=UPI003B9AA1F5
MKLQIEENIHLSELAKKVKVPVQLIKDSNEGMLANILPSGTELTVPGFKDNECIGLFPSAVPQKVNKLLVNRKKNYDFHTLEKDLALLTATYPFIRQQVIGKSVLEKPIYELTIGNGSKKIHMNASFHANEWITSAALMQFLECYLLALIQESSIYGISVNQIYENTTLSIVPMVNPDGVNLVHHGVSSNEPNYQELMQMNGQSNDFSQWKANIRGIDLNNQFPALWEIEKERKEPKSPAPRDYPGDNPLTEPEAIVMAELVKKKKFDRLIAFHTQGEEIYWGYLQKEPDEAALIVKEFSIRSGYKAVQNIDSHAGFRDWFINEWGRAGFTVELGYGVNPLPIEQFESICHKGEGIFWASLYL